VEFKAVICVGVFNRSINTANFSIARINSASIVVIADNRSGDTTRFKITRIGITFIVLDATIRIFSNYTSFILIAVSFVTFIRGNTFSRNINEYTSSLSTAAIFSTSIIIVTFNFFIFTRIIFSTIRITCINGTRIIIITFDSGRRAPI